MPVGSAATYSGAVKGESFDERSGRDGGDPRHEAQHETPQGIPVGLPGPLGWLQNANRSPGVIAAVRRVRRALPGDPDFGDPLSVSGDGGPRAAARVADRLLERDAASREVSLGALQVWQALTERVSGKPANREVTLVFTDLVGFSSWSLRAGDDATLRLLRRVAQVAEPPLLEARGHIVKRMGDGMMAAFTDPTTALRAVLVALDAVNSIEVDGYTPRMRVGMHTGRPQRIGSDWLGVDVNITARVMERAAKGGLMVSHTTLAGIADDDLAELGVTVKRERRQIFSPRREGVPQDLVMYRVRTPSMLPGRRPLQQGPPDA
ncbi:adenylate/guanylate cyclase domain-containing protein [Mycolicibacterium goodii]|uniref:Adenylate/guanylate cyclase domain-containing protein n=1 Tax=Mycolicibacterium goodii TaxID=134601 RepID=A0ABS6HY55_MYCGD|nr:adenylate/guanylate cyclase domain-containing protein [Mycolicibacterium goodii]MBU8841350.1 adenylate/guanylate cyclase domain-containing protein [Mycolicibacterium goodii]